MSDSAGGSATSVIKMGDGVIGMGVGSSVGGNVGNCVIRGRPNNLNTVLKFSFRSSFIVTSIEEQSEWQPRTNVLLTVSMKESSAIPPSTN